MANVYAARHEKNGRLAAVKILHSHLACDHVATARFLREAQVLSRIVHPNIASVFDVGEEDDVPYFAMTLVEGEDLTRHLRRLNPMSMGQIAECMLPVIDAVTAAHHAGIVHRDLKPSNIRFTYDARGRLVPKVLDFGISKLQDNDMTSELTESGVPLGTVSYMSPEQLRSARRVDARSDIYALGVLLYECATGKRPFRGESTYDLMHAILTAHLAPPSFLLPNIAPDFDALVLRAMAREPTERFASAHDLYRALATFCSRASGRPSVDMETMTRESSVRLKRATLRSVASATSITVSSSDGIVDVACTWEDLELRIGFVPPDAVIRGMFLTAVQRVAPGALKGTRRYVPFSMYPVREYMRLLVRTARFMYPRRSPASALFELGTGVYSAFSASIAGAAILSAAHGDFRQICRAAEKSYAVTLKPGSAKLAQLSEGEAFVQLRDVWIFPEIFHAGIWIGAMRDARVCGNVEITCQSPSDVDLHLRWRPIEKSRRASLASRPEPRAVASPGGTSSRAPTRRQLLLLR